MLLPLLIEIGVEELPAIPLLKELPNIEAKWIKVLDAYSLLGEFEFYYTPRRLVLWHREFLSKQNDSIEELFGAPITIAFKDGEPTQAALGFAKKCGVAMDQVGTIEKDGKEVLYFKKERLGQDAKELLPAMVTEFVQSLTFGKSMRWGSNSEGFIRPIRWLNLLLGQEVVPMDYLGVRTLNHTFIHRQKSFEACSYGDPKSFFELLEQGGVELFPSNRESKILAQFKAIEAQHSGLSIDINEELLAEVVAITEHPVSLLGSFSKEFLELPNEVVITSMREHQRYFPVYENGALSNQFVVVSNAICSDYSEVIKGNEKVLHARLSDALFFYHNDLKRGLVSEGLERVTFMKGLGSLQEKISREQKIAENIFQANEDMILKSMNLDTASFMKLIKDFFAVSKADLMSEMVYEFTELQGIMGFYYAKKLNMDTLIADAIKEQYLPSGEESDLPSNAFSAIVAIAVKLDSLMGLFSIDQIPTGSRDPFALRRAVNGIIRTALAHQIPLDIHTLLEENRSLYQAFEMDKLKNFFIERIYPLYKVNTSIVKAVLDSDDRNLLEIDKKIHAVNAIAQSEQFKELSSLFKRVANITSDMDLLKPTVINPTLFIDSAEKELHDRFLDVSQAVYENYEQELDALVGLSPQLASFFDNVMVNAEDPKLKNNRKNLIACVYKSFKSIADIKEITI